MIKKLILFVFLISNFGIAAAADSDAPSRVTVFSTSSDWQAITGLRLNQHRVEIIPDKTIIDQGLELYYLDGFPCYGEGGRTFYWQGPWGEHSDWDIMVVCIYPPTELLFAWHHAKQDAFQETTTGLLKCPVEGEHTLTVNMSKCTFEKDWKEYK